METGLPRDAILIVNAAAIGLSPMIGQTVPHKFKRYFGTIGYLNWPIWCALRFRSFRVTIVHEDGCRGTLWATEVRIANGTHHGGLELIESQPLDSGEIVIQVVTRKNMWRLGWSWFASILKLRARHGTLREFRGARMSLSTRPRHKISIDDEVVARTPVTVSVARGVFEVAAPQIS